MDVCLVCVRLRIYWGVTGALLLISVLFDFFPIVATIFLINFTAMIFTEQFALLTQVWKPYDEQAKEQGMQIADKSELRFLYFLASTFTGVSTLLYYLGYPVIASVIVLMCVVIFTLAAAGFCLGRIIYMFVKKFVMKRGNV